MDESSLPLLRGLTAWAAARELARVVVAVLVLVGISRRPDVLGMARSDGLPGQPGPQGPDYPAGDLRVRVRHGAGMDRGLYRPLFDAPLAPAGRRRDLRFAAGSWSGRRGRLVRIQRVRLAGRGDDGILGDGSWHLPAGRRRGTCVAFAAGLMYLAQMRRLKSNGPARLGLTLPSLEQSERVNRGAITIAFPLLTFGLLIGMILSVKTRSLGPEMGFTLSWTDPKCQRPGHVAGLRRASARAVPAGLARTERDGSDDRGLCLPGVHVGRNRGAQVTHGPWCCPDGGRAPVRLLAVGVDHRSAPASVREALAFDEPKYTRGLEASRRPFPATSS